MEEIGNGMYERVNVVRLFRQAAKEKLVCVSAPAGYGKTVALWQWLSKQKKLRHAVLTLDAYDNDLHLFCKRFCKALIAIQPKTFFEGDPEDNSFLEEIINHPSFDGAPDSFAMEAIFEVDGVYPAVLVLDDLHVITEKKVLEVIKVACLRLMGTIKIVLVTRDELPEGLSGLWLEGRMARVTQKDLLFTGEDIKKLYNQRGKRITTAKAEEVRSYTGGWPLGVNAMILSSEAQGEGLSDKKLNHMSQEYLEKFIKENIWNKWDEDTRGFMMVTALARELDPELCDALTGRSDSEEVLRGLVKAGAFVFRTGDGGYYYHSLFHTFLKGLVEEQGTEAINALYRKEGEWYLAKRDFYSAIDRFTKCEDYDGIGRCFGLLAEAGREYFFIDKLLPITHIPAVRKAAEQFPYIYSLLAWAAFNEGHPQEMAGYADLYYENQMTIVRMDPRLRLNFVLVRLMDFRYSIEDLPSWFENMPSEWLREGLKGAGVNIGTINQNFPLLHRGTRDFSEYAVGFAEDNVAALEKVLGGFFGEATPILSDCLLAGIFYEQGRMEKAYKHAMLAYGRVVDVTPPETDFFVTAILVYILDALGESKKAEWELFRLRLMIERERAHYLNRNLHALTVRRMLQKGDVQAAQEWLKNYQVSADKDLPGHEMYITYTTVRALIVVGDYDSAIMLLAKSLELAKAMKRPMGAIEGHVLMSIAFWKKKRGFQDEAMWQLERAVTLANEYGFTQVFINEGAELLGMLRRLQKRMEQPSKEERPPVSFVRLLYIGARECQEVGLTSNQPEPRVKYTERQILVMRLLCQGKSYNEIAEGMGIKRPTLRSHLALIYKKLGVTSEADAIKRIKAQGLLSEEAAETVAERDAGSVKA